MFCHSSCIVTYKKKVLSICIAILSDPCLKLWVAWSSSLPAWCRTTSSGNLAEIEPAGNCSRSEFWGLCFAHRWTGVCTAAQGDHSRDKDYLASWAPESLSNCTSAISLIFVLHFKCSVLILDKKNELYKTLACPLTSLALLVCSLLTRRVSHFVRTIERQSTTL